MEQPISFPGLTARRPRYLRFAARWVVFAAVLAVAPATISGSSSPQGGSQSVQALLRSAQDEPDFEKLQELARRIARAHGRPAVPILVDTVFTGDAHRGTHIVCALALSEIADPEGKRRMREAALSTRFPASSPHFMTAGLAALGDESALAMLREVAGGRRWDSPEALVGATYAAGFLRDLGDSSTLEWAKSEIGKAGDLHVQVRTALEALAASLEYRLDDSKSEADRQAYRSFERSLWWALAMAFRGGRRIGTEYPEATEAMKRELKTIDARFVRRIRETQAVTREERLLAEHL